MPNCSHTTAVGCAPRKHAVMNDSFSFITQVSFHGIGKDPPLPTKKTCQASIRSILSDIYPVRTHDAPLTLAGLDPAITLLTALSRGRLCLT
jgi:hypothetical protein